MCMWRPLCNVERVEYEDVMVVLGEGDHISLAGDLQAATAGHLQPDGRGSLIDGWTAVLFRIRICSMRIRILVKK